MPGGDLYELAGVQVPGATVCLGGFQAIGAGAVGAIFPNAGSRFSVAAIGAGEWKVTLAHGAFLGVYAVRAQLEYRAANGTRRCFVKDSSQLTVDGSFIVTTQQSLGFDSYGLPFTAIVWLFAALQQTPVAA